MDGYKLLESMRNDKLWKKIKSGIGNHFGTEILKKIPASVGMELLLRAIP